MINYARKFNLEIMKGSLNPFGRIIAAVFIALVFSLPSRAMVINVTYDSSVTSIGNSNQVRTAFSAAVQTITNLFTNACTLNIGVYGPNSTAFGNIGLGESSFSYYSGFVYGGTVGMAGYVAGGVTNSLRIARTTLADSNSVASLTASDPVGGGNALWGIPFAEAKALDGDGDTTLFVDPNGSGSDGDVGFASGTSYTFDPNNRAFSGKYDFIGVAEHEITEVMGRSTLDLGSSGYFPYDLFRFTNNSARSFNTNANASNIYFSVDNGVTALKYFNPDNNGGDIQDWASSTPPDCFDAAVPPGSELMLSAADMTALDVIGYQLNYKPPHLAGTNMASGNFQLNFTNTPGTSYTILATTNISIAITNWTNLGTTTETAAGQFQFTDTQANANKLRFYRARLN